MEAEEVCLLRLVGVLRFLHSSSDRYLLCVWLTRHGKSSKRSFSRLIKSLTEYNVASSVIEKLKESLTELEQTGTIWLFDVAAQAESLLTDETTEADRERCTVYRASPVGQLIRRGVLNFRRLSESQVSQLYESLLRYLSRDSDDDALSEEKSAFAENYHVEFLEQLYRRNYTGALSALHRCFNFKQLSKKDPNPRSVGHSSQAALCLAMFHYQFGETELALHSLSECIRIAHTTEDKVCLEHALGWLYTLPGSDFRDSQALIDTYIQQAKELKLPDGELLGLLRKFHDCIQELDCPPSKLFAQMESNGDEDSTRFALTTGMTSSGLLLQGVLWNKIGQRLLASLHSQMLLRAAKSISFLSSGPTTTLSLLQQRLSPQNEFVCLAAVSLASTLADQGDFDLAMEQLRYAESVCPVGSLYYEKWMICKQILNFNKAVYQEDWILCEEALHNIKVLDVWEGRIRNALYLLRKKDFVAALKSSRRLCEETKDLKSAKELFARALLIVAEAYLSSNEPSIAFDKVQLCLAFCEKHFLWKLRRHAKLLLAEILLALDLPTRALDLLRSTMIDVLAHGSVAMKGMARFLLGQATLSRASADSEDISKTVLSSVVSLLEAAFSSFKLVQALVYMKQVLHLQLHVLQLLNHKEECIHCAKTLKELI
ncbi:anaphase-promoting complex subunit 5-like isoform X2 [Oscarella lobularis]|uniref:anaphase-promoting complex subunit 5-like isoform X2 n=1 Tax=Oscarella lobularis TaxID=121494 RepID=UPI0033131346